MLYKANDGNCEIEIEADSAEGAAREYVAGGDWTADGEARAARRTIWIDVYVWSADGDRLDAERIGVTLDPPEPECDDRPDHDWQSPYELLGGMEENSGVQGHGGGVVITEVCTHCGAYRITDTWAQRPDTGEQGLTSVEYRPDDERSLAWVARRDGATIDTLAPTPSPRTRER